MSVTAPKGFRAGGVAAGIKPNGLLDLALVDAGRPVPVAGVFTTSRTAAPPVIVSRSRVSEGVARGVVINSGSANAGTGEAGVQDATRMAETIACEIDAAPEEVLVSSTGPIGGRLPLDLISSAAARLVKSLGAEPSHSEAAARAIMTTDSIPKMASAEGPGFKVGGIAKGAGMIRPDMATMLAFLTTDADLGHEALQAALTPAVATTFNCLNIDGCQSTNDTVLLFASGEAGVRPSASEFESVIRQVCASLALQMAADAEGASKVVHILVSGTPGDAEARAVGMKIADSALVRSSFYGADPNWGRILAAVGVAGVEVDQGEIDIYYEGERLCWNGVGEDFDEDALSARLEGDFTVSVSVGSGPGAAEVITTDLTPEYVMFNGERS